jgi:Leucine-rich repeat (LRR) protein
MKNLSELEVLTIYSNQLTSVPEFIGASGHLLKLKVIDLEYNKINSLHESIGNLLNLEYLNLAHNKLTSLPESIGDLKRLKNLRLQGNELVSLPLNIVNLSNLEYFDISSNKLSYLPDFINLGGSLPKLKYLNIKYNNIKILPNYLKNKLLDRDFEMVADPNVKKIEAKYFDSNKNKHIFEDVNEINNLSDKKCSYCKKEPITGYCEYKNNEAHFICSQNCSDKIFHNINN